MYSNRVTIKVISIKRDMRVERRGFSFQKILRIE